MGIPRRRLSIAEAEIHVPRETAVNMFLWISMLHGGRGVTSSRISTVPCRAVRVKSRASVQNAKSLARLPSRCTFAETSCYYFLLSAVTDSLRRGAQRPGGDDKRERQPAGRCCRSPALQRRAPGCFYYNTVSKITNILIDELKFKIKGGIWVANVG